MGGSSESGSVRSAASKSSSSHVSAADVARMQERQKLARRQMTQVLWQQSVAEASQAQAAGSRLNKAVLADEVTTRYQLYRLERCLRWLATTRFLSAVEDSVAVTRYGACVTVPAEEALSEHDETAPTTADDVTEATTSSYASGFQPRESEANERVATAETAPSLTTAMSGLPAQPKVGANRGNLPPRATNRVAQQRQPRQQSSDGSCSVA
jgi:hypothetical protein